MIGERQNYFSLNQLTNRVNGSGLAGCSGTGSSLMDLENQLEKLEKKILSMDQMR